MQPILYLAQASAILASVSEGLSEKNATVRQYDAMRAITALQGIVNRECPRLFLLTEEHDGFWLDYMSEEGGILCGRERVELTSLDRILSVFAKEIEECGLVLWDEALPATANVAGTMAGVEDVIPLCGNRADGYLLDRICAITGARVRFDLRGLFSGRGTIPGTDRPSSGSAKCDAYLWAAEHYLARTAHDLLFYTLDGMSWEEGGICYPDLGNAFVYNQDYAVSKRAFVFDLSCWGDETPCDDRDQPMGCDLATMKEILSRKYDQNQSRSMITVCGFVPWHVKYTVHRQKGGHGEVDSEWRFTEILSAYNCIKDADAAGYCALANASVYCHHPLKPRYENRRPTKQAVFDPDTRYILIYVGDYDASAWTARFIPRWYRDPNRGTMPLMWCFNPNLSDRIPQAFDFAYTHYSDQDYFAAGDSGAGYLNPHLCYEPRIHSDKPSGVALWEAHNKRYFQRFDLDIIGFVIDGDHLTDEREMKDMARYATRGVGYLSLGRDLPTRVVEGSVFCPVSADVAYEGANPKQSAESILYYLRHQNPNKRFFLFRTVLNSPGALVQMREETLARCGDMKVEFVDPISFFAMAKEAVLRGQTY